MTAWQKEITPIKVIMESSIKLKVHDINCASKGRNIWRFKGLQGLAVEIEELRNSDRHLDKVSSLIFAWLKTFKLMGICKFTCSLSVF